MVTSADVREAFPELEAISDPELRETVVEAWVEAMDRGDHDAIGTIPYLSKYTDYLGEVDLGTHVRQTTQVAIAIAEAAEDLFGGSGLDRDLVVAGCLLHDISKVLETPRADDPDGSTEIGTLLGHPHYAVHLIADRGLPVELQHIALSHSPKTGVGIRTAEAVIVWAADVLALNCLAWAHSGRLTPSFRASPMGAGE